MTSAVPNAVRSTPTTSPYFANTKEPRKKRTKVTRGRNSIQTSLAAPCVKDWGRAQESVAPWGSERASKRVRFSEQMAGTPLQRRRQPEPSSLILPVRSSPLSSIEQNSVSSTPSLLYEALSQPDPKLATQGPQYTSVPRYERLIQVPLATSPEPTCKSLLQECDFVSFDHSAHDGDSPYMVPAPALKDDVFAFRKTRDQDEGYESFISDEVEVSAGDLSPVREDHIVSPVVIEFYAVHKGRERGIFVGWEGDAGAKKHVNGFAGAQFQSFINREEAEKYLQDALHPSPQSSANESLNPSQADNEPQLCAEQRALVDLSTTGGNIFFTGAAGTGKSRALQGIVEALTSLRKRVSVVAPTGLAALNIGGQTYHSWAGWTLDTKKRELAELEMDAQKGSRWSRLNCTDVLIVDEISMIDADTFDRLDRVCRAARAENTRKVAEDSISREDFRSPRSADLPFGGIQIIVTGDYRQLSPVKPFNNCYRCGRELRNFSCSKCQLSRDREKPYSFCSNAWRDCNFQNVQLKTPHRQADPAFLNILNTVRDEKPLSQQQIQLLLDHPSETNNGIHLYPKNDESSAYNKEQLDKINAPLRTFTSHDDFCWRRDRHPELADYQRTDRDGGLSYLRDHRLERELETKEGMLVMLVANIDPLNRLVNGSQGRLIGYHQYNPDDLTETDPSSPQYVNYNATGEYAAYQARQVKHWISNRPRDQSFWPIVRFLDGEVRKIYPICRLESLGDEKEYSLLSRTQIPLIPAWAISIHKSQGLSLDKVIVHLDQTFSRGMAYVALSRARSLRGLKVVSENGLRNLSGRMPEGMHVVTRFLQKIFGEQADGDAISGLSRH